MATHDFNDEGTRVREGGGFDVVDRLANAVESSWGTNSHVGHGHVIINGADETDDLEMSIGLGQFFRDLTYNLGEKKYR